MKGRHTKENQQLTTDEGIKATGLVTHSHVRGDATTVTKWVTFSKNVPRCLKMERTGLNDL